MWTSNPSPPFWVDLQSEFELETVESINFHSIVEPLHFVFWKRHRVESFHIFLHWREHFVMNPFSLFNQVNERKWNVYFAFTHFRQFCVNDCVREDLCLMRSFQEFRFMIEEVRPMGLSSVLFGRKEFLDDQMWTKNEQIQTIIGLIWSRWYSCLTEWIWSRL